MTTYHTAVTLLAAAILAPSAAAYPSYSEDFQSFTVGPINQQQGWMSPAGGDAVILESPSLNLLARYQYQPTEGSLPARPEWGLVGAPFLAAYGRLELDVTVTAGGDTPAENWHHIATEDPITGFLNTRVELTAAGEIRVYTASGFGFDNDPVTRSAFIPGETLRLAIETTPAGTLRIYQNGALIHEGAEFATGALGADRAGRIGRVSAWNWTNRTKKSAASSLTIDNITFTPTRCPGDFNDDGVVDSSDLAGILSRWEDTRPGGPADMDTDGVIGAIDLASLLAFWGDCPG